MPSATVSIGSDLTRMADGSLVRSGPIRTLDVDYVQSFVRIGQSAFTLLVGLLGGLAAQGMRARE